jgi:hypothetical protein
MRRSRDFKLTPIKRVVDISAGDIIYTANEHPNVHLVARVYESTEMGGDSRFVYTVVSSGTGKVYDIVESLLGLLKMQKIVFKS